MNSDNRERREYTSNNPLMQEKYFEGGSTAGVAEGSAMTLAGTATKLGVLTLVVLIAAVFGWTNFSYPMVAISCAFTWIFGFTIAFKPNWAPFVAGPYAIVEGLFLGSFSFAVMAYVKTTENGAQYANAVPLAAFATILTLLVTLGLYASRIVRVGDTFRAVVYGMTGAIALFYLFSNIVGMFAPGFVSGLAVNQSGPIGIGFSLFCIGVAVFNFFTNFDMIERGIQNRAPKYMEWFGAVAVMVTLCWLYFEIIKLVWKLSRR